jgi:hypothetical protein
MAISRQVKCINKNDRASRHERITHIGGDWGYGGARIKITEAQAITDIENDSYTYHVRVNSFDVSVIIAMHLGRKYLKTASDSTTVDNLLSLPECA